MNNILKFPNGFDIKVVRKQDILDCIDANIIDKEIAYELVKQCEIDATNFLLEGRWAGIPFLGNIRIPRFKQRFNTEEVKEIYQEAKETMDENTFVLFSKGYRKEIARQVKQSRYYNYILSTMVTKNNKVFKAMCNEYGVLWTRLYFYTLHKLKAVN